MKFRVTMKDPDTLHDAIREAVDADLNQMVPQLDDEEKELLSEGRCEKVSDICYRWFKYSEYLTVEIDTDAMTCVVVDNKER